MSSPTEPPDGTDESQMNPVSVLEPIVFSDDDEEHINHYPEPDFLRARYGLAYYQRHGMQGDSWQQAVERFERFQNERVAMGGQGLQPQAPAIASPDSPINPLDSFQPTVCLHNTAPVTPATTGGERVVQRATKGLVTRYNCRGPTLRSSERIRTRMAREGEDTQKRRSTGSAVIHTTPVTGKKRGRTPVGRGLRPDTITNNGEIAAHAGRSASPDGTMRSRRTTRASQAPTEEPKRRGMSLSGGVPKKRGRSSLVSPVSQGLNLTSPIAAKASRRGRSATPAKARGRTPQASVSEEPRNPKRRGRTPTGGVTKKRGQSCQDPAAEIRAVVSQFKNHTIQSILNHLASNLTQQDLTAVSDCLKLYLEQKSVAAGKKGDSG